MSNGKEIILERIRMALQEVPPDEKPEDVNVPREYRQKSKLEKEERVALFTERAGEYKATVKRIQKNALSDAISEACRREMVNRLVVPFGIPEEWLPDFIEAMPDQKNKPLSNQQLDNSDGVITICAGAIAETGTIILDAGEGQGRRALTLVPDYHLCIVYEDQITELVPEGFAKFGEEVKNKGVPITFISGPSATSDIELSRVEGVHGPRRLEIVIVGE